MAFAGVLWQARSRLLRNGSVHRGLRCARNTPPVQVEGSFSQPNAGVCQHMLSWAQSVTRPPSPPAGDDGAAAPPRHDHDLLELYCGNANFTIPLAANFRRVVATELAKSSVEAAKCVTYTCRLFCHAAFACAPPAGHVSGGGATLRGLAARERVREACARPGPDRAAGPTSP